jgi:hypothetical protein
MRITMLLLMAGCLAPAAHLRADEDTNAGSELSKVTFGEHWYGTDFKPKDLKGRITLLAFWGFN